MDIEKENTQIVVMAGGEGKRMEIAYSKALVKLGNNTLLDRLVGFFSRNGFRNFVFVLPHNDERVTKHIDHRNFKNLHMEKVYDYEKGIGSGKAFKQALLEGKIDRTKRSIYTNPDDMFVDPLLPSNILKAHLRAVNRFGVLASDVVVNAHNYPFGVARSDRRGLINKFEEKPLIPLLTSTGIRIFEPESYRYFLKFINLKKPGNVGFEYEILPRLARAKKVYAIVIPAGTWITVNTQKDLEQAKKLVAKGVLPKS